MFSCAWVSAIFIQVQTHFNKNADRFQKVENLYVGICVGFLRNVCALVLGLGWGAGIEIILF